jgi:hypothetical protein
MRNCCTVKCFYTTEEISSKSGELLNESIEDAKEVSATVENYSMKQKKMQKKHQQKKKHQIYIKN